MQCDLPTPFYCHCNTFGRCALCGLVLALFQVASGFGTFGFSLSCMRDDWCTAEVQVRTPAKALMTQTPMRQRLITSNRS
jgi:hypothetical protein